MSSMHRTIEGEVLINHLSHDELMIDQEILLKHGRTARTLVKEGPLRLTLQAIAPGGNVPMHDTAGPVTIHALEGELLFKALDKEYPLSAGDVLVLAPGVPHSATSTTGGKFLLTVFHAPSGGSRAPIL
jgi:quercetin dioxygenase-like cupin family protein